MSKQLQDDIRNFNTNVKKETDNVLKLLAREMAKFLRKEMKDVLKEKSPKGHSRSISGNLLKSISYKVRKSTTGYTAKIGPSQAKPAIYIILGRPAGKAPPPEAMASLIKRKGIPLAKSAAGVGTATYVQSLEQSAYLMGQYIAREGVPPFDFVAITLDRAEPTLIQMAQQKGLKLNVRRR